MPQLIYVIIAAIGGAILYFKKGKKEDVHVMSKEDRLKAHVLIYSDDFKVDGKDIHDLSFKNLRDESNVVSLWGGVHNFDCIFEADDIDGTRTVKLKTNRIKFSLDLKANNTYTLGLYVYSAEKRRKYYNDSVGEVVLEIPVAVRGSEKEAYVICYNVDVTKH